MKKILTFFLFSFGLAQAAQLEINFLDGTPGVSGEIEKVNVTVSENNRINSLTIEAGFRKTCVINRSSINRTKGSQPPFEGLSLLFLADLIKRDAVDIKCNRNNASNLGARLIEIDYKN